MTDPDTMPQHAAANPPPPPTESSPLRDWARAAGIRAIKTAAQAALATIPLSAATIGGVDWALVAGTAALSAILSLLTSVTGLPEVDSGSSVTQLAGK